jgi:hypothetical protein
MSDNGQHDCNTLIVCPTEEIGSLLSFVIACVDLVVEFGEHSSSALDERKGGTATVLE